MPLRVEVCTHKNLLRALFILSCFCICPVWSLHHSLGVKFGESRYLMTVLEKAINCTIVSPDAPRDVPRFRTCVLPNVCMSCGVLYNDLERNGTTLTAIVQANRESITSKPNFVPLRFSSGSVAWAERALRLSTSSLQMHNPVDSFVSYERENKLLIFGRRPVIVAAVHEVMYYHQLLDDVFAWFRALEHHGLVSSLPSFMLLDDSGPYGPSRGDLLNLMMFRATRDPSKLDHKDRPSWQSVVATSYARLVCFKQLVVGSGGLQIGGPGTLLAKRPDDVRRFRSFLHSQLRLQPPKHQYLGGSFLLKILVVQRASRRQIINIVELITALKESLLIFRQQVSVEVGNFAGMPIHEQAILCHSASLFIGVHGSAFTNMMFLDDRWASVIEIMPTGVIRKSYEVLAQDLGIDYHVVNSNSSVRGNEQIFFPQFLDEAENAERAFALSADRFYPGRGLYNERYWINQDLFIDTERIAQLAVAIISKTISN